MTQKDYRIIFTALGFLAVILRNDVPKGGRALRAKSIAQLIESFCVTEMPEMLDGKHMPSSAPVDPIEHLLECYVTELLDEGSSDASFDRQTLLRMYELLLTQKMRHEQREFYAVANEDLIANVVLQLASEKIDREAR